MNQNFNFLVFILCFCLGISWSKLILFMGNRYLGNGEK